MAVENGVTTARRKSNPSWTFPLRTSACVFPPACRFFASQMQRWIDQAKNKLLDIIAQAKEDVANISLRVAFVG